MKKGDLKKAELIRTAEQLFCRNGYEQTSVQDILDILNTSKGSFYHHFPSKEALLEAMCRQRAETIAEELKKRLSASEMNLLEKLNACLSAMLPLKDEKVSFLLMILPVLDMPEGWSVKRAYQESLSEAFSGILSALLSEGSDSGILFCPHADVQAHLIGVLMNDLWEYICESIIRAEKTREQVDPSEMLVALDQYRSAVERMITAPYGSLSLMAMPELKSLIDAVHLHWKTI
ncbi:MAG: TetR/AcrR family transcriptional regulator [Anaerolineaceae bacterium]|nr:TetR/AcrR family transcriptional regulator [Anaerolineaceae bacterium]